MAMSGPQCRAARALIGWSQDQLVGASKVAKATIANFEAGRRLPYDRTLTDLQRALESAGIIFVDENGEGLGVRLRKTVARMSEQIAEADAAADVAASGDASPEKGMAMLRQGLAENDAKTLREKRRKARARGK